VEVDVTICVLPATATQSIGFAETVLQYFVRETPADARDVVLFCQQLVEKVQPTHTCTDRHARAQARTHARICARSRTFCTYVHPLYTRPPCVAHKARAWTSPCRCRFLRAVA
jgi:hypothetical protein